MARRSISNNGRLQFDATLVTDATALQGIAISEDTPEDNQILLYDAGGAAWTPTAQSGIDHGALSGLADDDHTQYLKVDGTRAMTGNLNMGNQAITSVGNVDGVDVSALKTDVDEFPDSLKNLTADEITQLAEIGAAVISAAQWGYLGALDQSLATTDSPEFDVITANELLTNNMDGLELPSCATQSLVPKTDALYVLGSAEKQFASANIQQLTAATVVLPQLTASRPVLTDGDKTLESGLITNAHVDASAGIVDTKLATISTAGKVENSATSATATNAANSIVQRDANGLFSCSGIQLPYARFYGSTTECAAQAWTDLTFTTTSGSGIVISGSKSFEVPENGLYLVTASLHPDSNGQNHVMQVSTSANTNILIHDTAPDGGASVTLGCSGAFIGMLMAEDVYECRVWNDHAADAKTVSHATMGVIRIL